MVDAIRNKYASQSESVPAVRISGKEVEEIGFSKIQRQLANLHELRIVLLDGLCITGLDQMDLPSLGTVSPNIEELDLSRNLFEKWTEILEICRPLPELTSLRSDGNRFREISSQSITAFTGPPFMHMKSLTLDDTLLDWAELACITSSFPGLEDLAASGNDLRALSDASLPGNITHLNLERNEFGSLHDIHPLSRMKALRRLNLKGNAISCIEALTATTEQTKSCLVFSSSVQDVDLSYNKIKEWNFIDKLGHVFPGMTALRVSQNPLYNDMNADDAYTLTIARLGSLTQLNYSMVWPRKIMAKNG